MAGHIFPYDGPCGEEGKCATCERSIPQPTEYVPDILDICCPGCLGPQQRALSLSEGRAYVILRIPPTECILPEVKETKNPSKKVWQQHSAEFMKKVGPNHIIYALPHTHTHIPMTLFYGVCRFWRFGGKVFPTVFSKVVLFTLSPFATLLTC